MKWVTWEQVGVDRMACPWLIKKFVDKDAEFLFAPNDRVMEVAEREGAIPYDVNYPMSRSQGLVRGFTCIEDYSLDATDPDNRPVDCGPLPVGLTFLHSKPISCYNP